MKNLEEITAKDFRKLRPAGRKQQPETPIRNAIRDYLQVHGWKVTRFVQSALSEPGIPDLVAIREGRHVWIEVKAPKGNLSGSQEDWLQDLKEHGGSYIVARSVGDVEGMGKRGPTG